MFEFHLKFLILIFLSVCFAIFASAWCPGHLFQQYNRVFEQRSDRFWMFEEQSNSWVEVKLPYDLVSCRNGNCTRVGSINPMTNDKAEESEEAIHVPEQGEKLKNKESDGVEVEEDSDKVLPQRKRISSTKMTETSIWVTGESGSIYERFWNGLKWVIAPHDLPVLAGYAISVFIVNQTILALSEAGDLYQMQLSESSQPIWVEFKPTPNQSINQETEEKNRIGIKSGIVSDDGMAVYFCTKNGSLLELTEIDPPRWVNHGRPPGTKVAAIADAATTRPEVVFMISSGGDLYEYDRNSKPSWKKHIWRREGCTEDSSLMPLRGCSLYGLGGAHSVSLFLLTKGGNLVERRLHQRKWKWIVHGSPEGHLLTSITPASQDELNEKTNSLFLATAAGSIFEYQIPKHSGHAQDNPNPERWVNHLHPLHAKAARGIAGLQLQVGRLVFPLDDGRLGELHLSGLGGESLDPATHQFNVRRRKWNKYVWSILDAPESEGWNAEYCTEERGPSNCITGIKDQPNEESTKSIPRRRKGSHTQQSYLSCGASISSSTDKHLELEGYKLPEKWVDHNFRLRLMQEGRSFFYITEAALTFEYLHTENAWLWLTHEHQSTAMKGAVGNYNGSLFLVDMDGSLHIRERSSTGLTWINCTAMMRKGRQVIGGPPWDRMPHKMQKVTPEDALFFVSKNGRLLQFTVAMRKFKWKDCQNPPNTRVSCIVDQEVFRENIVFVIGRNGRLYQYNKVTQLWHEHHQSQHLVLSRLPGTTMRPSSSSSLAGSLFMLSENGGLVEYHWNALDGWTWVEHGTPDKSVILVSSPGPCIEDNQLFLIGSDGKVYLRYIDHHTTWKWKNCGFPYMDNKVMEDQGLAKDLNEEICIDQDFAAISQRDEESGEDFEQNCDPKVASIRPIPFSDDSAIFELRDGRLAELQRIEDTHWIWSRTIGTPTSLCMANYWTALAS